MRKIVFVLSLYFILSFMVFTPIASAQNDANASIEMAEKMRSEGKIYVVVLVVIILFSGLIIYAINTDRKVSKLEKEIKSLKSHKDS
jgi:uncharacterized BrkB/YihY/UPF0761 family membrane protein